MAKRSKKQRRPRKPQAPSQLTSGHGDSRRKPAHDPASYDREKIEWRFGIVDMDGPWDWRNVSTRDWGYKIFPKLKDYDPMTWAEILSASGGKKPGRGNHNHSVEVKKLSKAAKKRLIELNRDDVSELFSLRLDSTRRIYGIRDRQMLRILWYDPHHGNNKKAVCPVKKN